MAAWHGRAVMAQRDKYKDEINYNLALAIALRMGNDDSAATMAIATLAAEAHCHYNTADKRTKEMEAEGLLIIERGESKLLGYKIPGDFENNGFFIAAPPATPDHTNEIEKINGRLDILESRLEKLCEIVEKMSHDLHIIVTSSSHDLHTAVTPIDYANVNKEGKKGRREEVYVDAHAPGLPPYELPSDAEPFPEDSDQRMEMLSALSGTVKDVANVGTEGDKKFNQAIDNLIGRGITKEQVIAFREWWEANGYYKGKPSLTSLLQEIENMINGVTRVTSDNGNDYRPLWNQVHAEIKKNGRRSTRQWNDQIAPVLKKSGGYLRLCSLSLSDAEQSFKSAYQDMT